MFRKDKTAPDTPTVSHGLKAGSALGGLHMATAPTIGLALGSGLARGFAHLGVVRALKRHGIEPTVISGTSMGALVGGAYLANRLGAVEDWAYSLTKLRVLSYLDFRVKSSGLIGGKKLVELMERNFGDARVEDLPHPFISVAADL